MTTYTYPDFPWPKWLGNIARASAWNILPGEVDVAPEAFKELLQVACYEHGFNIHQWSVRTIPASGERCPSFTIMPDRGKAKCPIEGYVVRLWDDGRSAGRGYPSWPWEEWFSQPTTKLVYPVDFITKPHAMAEKIRRAARRYEQVVSVVRDAYLPHNWAAITIHRDMKKSPPVVRRPGGRPPGPPKPAKVRGPIGRPEKHPWGTWLDGRRHVLTRGVDFDMPAQQFAIMARAKANTARYPFGVTVQQRGQVVTVQARIEEAI